MGDSDLVVVFDLLDAGFEGWRFPAFGLIFIAIGFVMVRFPRTVMQFFNASGSPGFYKFFSWFWFLLSILWTVGVFAGIFGINLSIRDAYIDGRFEVVEGLVEDFDPRPPSGHANRSFTVAGQPFSYSDFTMSPGENNARALGGAIDAGVHVRISHVHGKIVRLEVERSAAAVAMEREVGSIWQFPAEAWDPPEGSLPGLFSRYFWIINIVFNFAVAAAWRLRGRASIARDPSLREGYNRMSVGLALWASFPVLVAWIASTFDDSSAISVWSFSVGSFWSVLSSVVGGFVIAMWLYWTFFRNGAAKMARHPGLIDHEWVAKFWPSACAVGYVLSIVTALRDTS